MSASISTLALYSQRSKGMAGEPYLRVQLAPNIKVVLAMHQIEEARILRSKQLTPMPNMPAPVLGLMSHRSRIRWVIDLPHLLGLPALEPNLQQYDVLLLKVNTIAFGLIVQRIENMVWFSPSAIQPPSEAHETIPSTLLFFLQGSVLQNQSALWVLNAEAIAEAVMNLSHLPSASL
jgi:twitching motility protein PilI